MSWSEANIEEIASVKGGKRLPPGHDFVESSTRHLYIRARDIGGGQVNCDQPVFISEDTHARIARYTVDEGDVVITIVGANVGDVGYVTERFAGANLTENAAKLVVDRTRCNPLFLKFFLATKASKEKLAFVASGAAQGKLGLYKIKSFAIPLPPLDVQVRIAEIARNYDALIENNRRRIALLEQAARLLYREWFVHFRFPGHETVKFVDGLPEGWEECSFADMAEYLNGFAFKPYHLGKHGLPIVKIPELKNGILDKTPYYDGREVPDKYLLTDGDLIFSWSGTLAIDFWNAGNSYLNQHLFKVTPKDGFSKALILTAVRECMPKFMGKAVGATMKHIRRSALEEVKHPLPPSQKLEEFNDLIIMKYDQVQLLKKQNVQLTRARDLLLPRLMDGRIPVKV